ncbi:MAG: fibrobacter succinogenes major paralogous domain-containing protein [Mariniphaga sp.]|nr:fibrobacter succinogenes major paralogous domain-containing protein [Mariniphaga sp.]
MKKYIITMIFVASFMTQKTHAQETGTFTDSRDGQVYKTVQIGSQVWMAENLAYLPSVSPPSSGSKTVIHNYVYDYDGSSVKAAKTNMNYSTYGVLYNWTSALKACPDGWHLPSHSEWTKLADYLGGLSVAGGKLKTISGWKEGGNGTDYCGFSGLPGGHRDSFGNNFESIRSHGHWWSATEYTSTLARGWNVYYDSSKFYHITHFKNYGFSVRCVKIINELHYKLFKDR